MVEFQCMKNYNAIPILQVCPGKITKVFRKELLSNDRNFLERSIFTPSGIELTSTRGNKISSAQFELKIDRIKLTKAFIESMGTQYENLSISWQIMNFPESILKTNIEKEETDLQLSVLYKIEEFAKFSEYLETNSVIFDLEVVKIEDSVKLATGEVFMSRALRSLKSKVYDQVDLYHVAEDEDKPILVGTLNIWYQLNSEKKSETELKTMAANSLTSITTTGMSFRSEIKYFADSGSQRISTCSLAGNFTNINNAEVTESEVKKFQEDLFLVLNRDKALRTTQGEISRELRDRAEWLNEEAIWLRTLQEYAILSGNNPFDVHWRQWRDVDTSQVILRSFPKKSSNYTPILDITIAQVVFYPSTTPYQNDEIEQIYVEYSFLNMEGPEMESDDTLLKPEPNEPAEFNFKKSFGIDLKKNRRHCLLIAEMIREKFSLRVSVVSEPLPCYEVPIQTCKEIGYAEVNFFNLVQLEENESVTDYPILDKITKEVIGTMKIEFSGVLALRKMALLVLAPDEYNIIV